jgi:2-polyprenyl-3-methyl-5-hydroxy-6-metoxy-1,4-benzoquinol methylase
MKAPGAYPAKKMKRRVGENAIAGLMEFIETSISKDQTIIDIGAGEGRHVRALRHLGYMASGIDGCEGIEEISQGRVKWCDISDHAFFSIDKYDWGLFIEVGEHISAEFEADVISNVSSLIKNGLIVSWATPGQRGYKHVNCRTAVYVASCFAHRGFVVDDELTQQLGELMGKRSRHKVMVLRRT